MRGACTRQWLPASARSDRVKERELKTDLIPITHRPGETSTTAVGKRAQRHRDDEPFVACHSERYGGGQSIACKPHLVHSADRNGKGTRIAARAYGPMVLAVAEVAV